MGWMILLGVIVGVIVLIIAIVIVRAQLKRPTTGLDGMIGEVGIVVSRLSPDGRVRIHGREIWNAVSLFPGEVIEAGEKVEVVRIDKTTLMVKRKEV